MSTQLSIGAHVDQTDPVAEAVARGTTLVQFFLGDPQGYKGPEVRYAGGAEALRADAEEAGVDLYVHAPYIVNVATTNNRIRIPSRKLLQQHMDAAAEIGAKGLIVHGGHVNKDDDPAVGFDNWRKAIRSRCRAIASADGSDDVGFCLDTCHAWAGGIELGDAVDRIRAITGRIDLVHANDSRDDFDSGADRHASFGQGRLPADEFAGVVREAGAPVICETPGGAAEHRADFAWLRERL